MVRSVNSEKGGASRLEKLKGKTAIVTGASRGLGKEIAKQLAQKGANLILIARNEARLAAVKQELEKEYAVQVDTLSVDLTDSAAVQNAAEQIFSRHDKVDFLINNAGVGHWNPILECTEEIFDQMLNVNLKAVFLLTNAILPNMVKHKDGMVVNVSSVMGHRVMSYQGLYSVAKFGLEALTKSYALEMQPHGVRVIAVNPAMINTEFRDNMEGRRPFTEEEKERMLQVSDVAGAIIWALETDRRVLPSTIMLENHLIKQVNP